MGKSVVLCIGYGLVIAVACTLAAGLISLLACFAIAFAGVACASRWGRHLGHLEHRHPPTEHRRRAHA